MPRYIIIDNGSGYVFGDTGDLDGAARDETPLEAVGRLDASIYAHGRLYADESRHDLSSNETGYHVYRADVRGSEAVPLVDDGQDQETIDSIVRDCEYVTTIRCTSAEV